MMDRKITQPVIYALISFCCLVGPIATKAESNETPFEDVSVNMTEMGDGYVRRGEDIALSTLNDLKPGMTKAAVTTLMGSPDLSHEKNGLNQWDYNLNIATGTSGDVIVCQYKVTFDESDVVKRTEWRRKVCERMFLAQQEYTASLQPEEVTPHQQEIPTFLSLSTDVLFDFNQFTLNGKGTQVIRELTAKIHREFSSPDITLTGHTDRLGSESFNQRLSIKRANAIRDFMTAHGIEHSQVTTQGFGELYPLVDCVTESKSELIQCLADNRRVEIEVVEDNGFAIEK